MSAPVEIEAARDRTSRSSGAALMLHLLGEPHERTAHRHVRRRDARFAERVGHVCIAMTHFDARDDGLSVLGLESLQRGLIPFERLLAYGFLERRRIGRWPAAIEWGGGPAFGPTNFVADPIHDG